MEQCPHVFTAGRIWIMGRLYHGASRIARLIARTHVLIRLKSDIPLKSPSYPPGMVAFARKSGASLQRRSRLGLSRLGCGACRSLRFAG